MTIDYFLYRDFYGNLDYEVDEESEYGTKLHIVTAVAQTLLNQMHYEAEEVLDWDLIDENAVLDLMMTLVTFTDGVVDYDTIPVEGLF